MIAFCIVLRVIIPEAVGERLAKALRDREDDDDEDDASASGKQAASNAPSTSEVAAPAIETINLDPQEPEPSQVKATASEVPLPLQKEAGNASEAPPAKAVDPPASSKAALLPLEALRRQLRIAELKLEARKLYFDGMLMLNVFALFVHAGMSIQCSC